MRPTMNVIANKALSVCPTRIGIIKTPVCGEYVTWFFKSDTTMNFMCLLIAIL